MDTQKRPYRQCNEHEIKDQNLKEAKIFGFNEIAHKATFGAESQYARNRRRHQMLRAEAKYSIQEYELEPMEVELDSGEPGFSSVSLSMANERPQSNVRRIMHDVVFEDSRHQSSQEYTFPVTSVRKQASDPNVTYSFEPVSERR